MTLATDKIAEIRSILEKIQKDKAVQQKLALSDSEIKELTDYVTRILNNWRICG
jgi:ribosomal protein S15P/S13E